MISHLGRFGIQYAGLLISQMIIIRYETYREESNIAQPGNIVKIFPLNSLNQPKTELNSLMNYNHG